VVDLSQVLATPTKTMFLADLVAEVIHVEPPQGDFCPSCYQKRLLEFGERLRCDVPKKVPHKPSFFCIPRILSRYFSLNSSINNPQFY